ncbi:MAG TPA: YraN family protein [Steroidobacteraceae bacterium]|nr:YraN family protein [Steroidobacteraceae bacterium]
MATHLIRGGSAEQLAAAYLEARHVRILARNYRCKLGELDLVVLDGPALAFVEIRQRSRADYGGAAASVTRGKRRRLTRAARCYLQENPALRHWRSRFDVVAVQGIPGAGCPLEWIKGAFDSE